MSDYIKREEALALAWYATYEDEWHMHKLEKVVSVEDIVGLPAADVVVRAKGEWKDEWFDHKWKIVCSECGCFADRMTDYCPNCGADMRGQDAE